MQVEKLGKYKIVGKIGHGAMGDVYKAHDTVLNRFVAIKTITGSLGSDDQFRQRFHREAQSAASLNHRNIVTVFEFAEEQGMVYMVMELLEGTDLKDLISRGALQRFEDKISIVEQMCDGLAFAHAKDVVHRDLKPANIHVLANGTVKIMDFGLARLGVSEMTRTGTVMGTPNYMSPEQVRGERVDSRSDIFSVGAVMYEVLAGHKPFEAESMHSVLFQVLDQNPEPIRNRTPEIPLPIAEVVDRALAKDPAQRFQGAGEMRAALRAARRLLAAGKASSAPLGTSSPVSLSDEGTVGRSQETLLSNDAADWATQGATALDLAPASRSEAPRTARPHPTMVGSAPAARSGWVYAVVAAGVLLIAVAGVFAWLRLRAGQGPAVPPAEVAREQERILRETLIASQVELAQGQLDNKSYADAIAQAAQVLATDADNAAAREIQGQAQAKLDEMDKAANEARAAFKRGDTDLASQKLTRVMAIDPGHPVVGELSAALDRQFRGQAEEARLTAQKARAEAEKGRAQSYEGFAASDRGVAEGERLLQGSQFVQATQKFLEAGDGFARARRAAEAAQAAAVRAAALPSAPAPQAARSIAPSAQTPAPSAPPVVTAVPQVVPPSSAPSTPGPSTATTAALPGGDPAIQKVLADYARAIETKDLGLFRSVKPGMSGDEEKGLREFFKNSGAYKVGLAIEAVKMDGGVATVAVSRADTAGGKAMKPYRQTFRLGQRGGGWFIQSIGN